MGGFRVSNSRLGIKLCPKLLIASVIRVDKGSPDVGKAG